MSPSISASLGYDSHLSRIPATNALGRYPRVVCQSHVHHTSFGWGHRLQGDASARGCHFARYPNGHVVNRLFPASPIRFHVHHNAYLFVCLSVDHQADKKLEGSHCFPTSPDEETGVFALDVDDRSTGIRVMGATECGSSDYAN